MESFSSESQFFCDSSRFKECYMGKNYSFSVRADDFCFSITKKDLNEALDVCDSIEGYRVDNEIVITSIKI